MFTVILWSDLQSGNNEARDKQTNTAVGTQNLVIHTNTHGQSTQSTTHLSINRKSLRELEVIVLRQ